MVRLYHGTSSVFVPRIEKDGLQPRGDASKGNYEHDLSIPTWVYLTDLPDKAAEYALYAIKKNGGTPVVVEVNVSENRLVADEDYVYEDGVWYIWQPGGKDEFDPTVAEALEERNVKGIEAIYQDYESYADPEDRRDVTWKASLKYLHTAAHVGPIRPEHIKSVAFFDKKAIKVLEMPKWQRPSVKPIRIQRYRRRVW